MPKNTHDDILIRRTILSGIITKLKREGKTINRFTLKPLLQRAGFDVDESTVYRDLTALNRENTWVRDLAESSYSAYQEDISDTLDWVVHQAKIQYKKKWTASKQMKKETGKGIVTEIVTTQELASPKTAFLNIILKAQELKMKHTNGENINVSAALLTKEFHEIKKRYEEQGLNMTPVDIIRFAKQSKSANDNFMK